jgi:CRISPR/Cas system CSM-associated protein Csm3 (group 7 of RAMP superfamily)
MSSLARASLCAAGCDDPIEHPVFIALFGSARGNGEGQASRLRVYDSRLATPFTSLTRDRNGINRRRGSADEKLLFHEEVVDGTWSFSIEMEFIETGPRTQQELQWQASGSDPDALAYRLLLDVLSLMELGWATIGGNSGIGYGRVRLEDCRIAVCNRCSPDEVLAYARKRWEAKYTNGQSVFPSQMLQDALPSAVIIPVDQNYKERPPERIRFRCILRPLEPLLVKTGYTTEVRSNVGSQRRQQEGLQLDWSEEMQEFPVDAGFCLDAQGKAYIPGSSVRGTLRSHVERIVRTIMVERLDEMTANHAAWDLMQAQDKGQQFSERETYDENDIECLVSRVFGFSALGGRILFSDAVPLDTDTFEAGRKLLDHVALDRFTGSAADKRKFNSRPYFPPAPSHELGSNGDLQCEVELYDFEPWHLGMLLLMLRDLRLGRITLGYGKNKGFGKVRLEQVEVEALTAPGGILEAALPVGSPSLGGFKPFATGLSFDTEGTLHHEINSTLMRIFRQAEQAVRQKLADWTPIEEVGGTS